MEDLSDPKVPKNKSQEVFILMTIVLLVLIGIIVYLFLQNQNLFSQVEQLKQKQNALLTPPITSVPTLNQVSTETNIISLLFGSIANSTNFAPTNSSTSSSKKNSPSSTCGTIKNDKLLSYKSSYDFSPSEKSVLDCFIKGVSSCEISSFNLQSDYGLGSYTIGVTQNFGDTCQIKFDVNQNPTLAKLLDHFTVCNLPKTEFIDPLIQNYNTNKDISNNLLLQVINVFIKKTDQSPNSDGWYPVQWINPLSQKTVQLMCK